MASRFWVTSAGSGTGTWDASDTTHWSATSGGLGGSPVPVAGDTVTFDALSCPLGETVTVNTNFSVTSVTMGAFTGTLDFSANNNSPTMQTFSLTGTGTRTLTMGSGTWTITGNNGTILNNGTTTNLTLNPGTSTMDFTYSGSTGTRTLTFGAGATIIWGNVKVSAGSDTVTFASNGKNMNDVDFTGFSGTWNGSGNGANIFGSLTVPATLIPSLSGVTLTFKATSGTKTITSNTVVLACAVTFDGVGGTFQLGDALNLSTSTLTLTNGTFNANNKNITAGVFNSNNSNTRTLTMGSGTWTLTGNNVTIWNTPTTTGMTLTATTANVVCNYSGSVGTRVFSGGIVSTSTLAPRFSVTAGSDIVSFVNNSGPVYQSFDFTGFSGSVTGPTNTLQIRDSLTLSSTMTFVLTGTGGLSFMGTSTNSVQGTITTNGVSIGAAVAFSGSGGSWILGDNFTCTGALTLTQTTFNANNKNITCASFSSSNTNTRTLTMGSGTWTLTGTGTVWTTATTTGLTLTPGTSTIKITDTSANDNTFAGGGKTFNNIWWSRGTSANANILTGSNTFSNFKDDGTIAHSIKFTAATTTTVNTWTVSGSAGQLISIDSDTTATHALVKATAGNVSSDYLSIQHSVATPAETWYAGSNSTNNQAVATAGSGWMFTPPSEGGFNLMSIFSDLTEFIPVKRSDY